MRIHRVYCKSVSGTNEIFKIDESQSHHLIRALRLKEDDIVEVFDGQGISAHCKIIKLSNHAMYEYSFCFSQGVLLEY